MSWFFVGAAVVASLGAIQGGRQQQAAAESQANMDEYNAKMAEIKARQTNDATSRKIDDQRKKARDAVGTQLAASAEAGAGLNGDLLRESLLNMETDTQEIRYGGDLEAQGLSDEAALARSSAVISRDRGKQAKSSSYLNAGSALLSGAASGYGNQQRIAAAKK